MKRAEFEQRLLEDEELRTLLAELRTMQERIAQHEAHVVEARQDFYSLIRQLIEVPPKLPPAFVARQVGLSPQRVNSILHEQKAKKPRKTKTKAKR